MSGAPNPVQVTSPGRIGRIAMRLSRDKSDTLLLIGAAVMVLAPHAAHLPLWVSALCGITLAWRAVVTFRGTRMPPGVVLIPLSIAAMGGIWLSYKTLLGRDAGVAMAVLLVAFKMLEMHAKRDLFVVIFLCFFLLLSNFFYSQGIGTGIMMVLAVIALLTAQMSFQYTGAVPPLRQRLMLGAKILAFAAPAGIALFFLFPRVQGPLWGMPRDAQSGSTGLSSSMSPGNLSNLAQSQEIAFRAKFEDRAPGQDKLYWRALVMDEFDGRNWWAARSGLPGAPSERNTALAGPALRYQVTLEPHNERWLFALDMPAGLAMEENRVAGFTPFYELRAGERITRRLRYDMQSNLSYRMGGGAVLADAERWLALPAGFNPLAMQAGLDLQRYADPAERVRKALAKFRTDNFSYTLNPPALGKHSVDEFLYQTRAGFCEHYASAFVFLMRSADVPARVVTGYQGGELNPVDRYLVVRQSDAHAWAEVWLGQRGWVRVDPTAAVAPERVQRNLARALPQAPSFGNMLKIELEENSWLSQLRFQLGAINNSWNQWVLNYDPERRRGLIHALADMFGNWRALAALGLVCCLIVVARALHLRSEKDPVDALYSALCQQMGRLGIARAGDEGPNAYAQRIKDTALAPDKKDAILRFLHLYSTHKYGPQAPDPALVSSLKRLLKRSQ